MELSVISYKLSVIGYAGLAIYVMVIIILPPEYTFTSVYSGGFCYVG